MKFYNYFSLTHARTSPVNVSYWIKNSPRFFSWNSRITILVLFKMFIYSCGKWKKFHGSCKKKKKSDGETGIFSSGLRCFWCSLLCLRCQVGESKYCSEMRSPYPLNSSWSDFSCWFFALIAPYCVSRWNGQASSDLSVVSPARPSYSPAWDLSYGWIPWQNTRWQDFLHFVWVCGNSAPWLHRRTRVPHRSGFPIYSG